MPPALPILLLLASDPPALSRRLLLSALTAAIRVNFGSRMAYTLKVYRMAASQRDCLVVYHAADTSTTVSPHAARVHLRPNAHAPPRIRASITPSTHADAHRRMLCPGCQPQPACLGTQWRGVGPKDSLLCNRMLCPVLSSGPVVLRCAPAQVMRLHAARTMGDYRRARLREQTHSGTSKQTQSRANAFAFAFARDPILLSETQRTEAPRARPHPGTLSRCPGTTTARF